ncbi:hypothetical protein MRX96_018053 [Rhipicephalus microplus]
MRTASLSLVFGTFVTATPHFGRMIILYSFAGNHGRYDAIERSAILCPSFLYAAFAAAVFFLSSPGSAPLSARALPSWRPCLSPLAESRSFLTCFPTFVIQSAVLNSSGVISVPSAVTSIAVASPQWGSEANAGDVGHGRAAVFVHR